MTLQYRTRDMSDDRRWDQRLRLSETLLMDVVDWWCRGDHDFPLDSTVASLLFIFSPRCDPFAIPVSNVKQWLFDRVDSPSVECARTWPRHDEQTRSDLIAALIGTLQQAIEGWNAGTETAPIAA